MGLCYNDGDSFNRFNISRNKRSKIMKSVLQLFLYMTLIGMLTLFPMVLTPILLTTLGVI